MAAWATRYSPTASAAKADMRRGLSPGTSDRVQSEYRFGGNINGIRAALPYLKDLGVQMLYTTPIFVSDSAHRYNTFDYYQIDPLLGTLDDFKALCDEAHAQGIRIILDGVFNPLRRRLCAFQERAGEGRAQ